ncbi:hypothetical protein RAS1_09390 [Phycisphaerae bacterium RAS1]|nr:hypothetical protein RAS1_09390 [Phycisphaerae bacterium RAS1]
MQNWLKSGWLKQHQSSRQEIAELFGLADRDLDACQTTDLVTDWRFNIAYNAALQLATAALAAAGYQAARMAHHFRVISSLELTLGWDKPTVELMNDFREKRNEADYERAGAISEADANEMLTLAQRLRTEVEAWIAQHYPHLKP